MDDEVEVLCDRCGKVISKDSPTWVELPTGHLRIVVVRDFDDAEPFTRAWHAQCLGAVR